MNWRFWTRPGLVSSDCCTTVQPLLSLHTDGMASPEEIKRIEVHLAGCAPCRQAWQWMQATRMVLSQRRSVQPPADLHACIAGAIAAAERPPAPVAPARPMRLRLAYAASVAVALAAVVLGGVFLTSPPVVTPGAGVQRPVRTLPGQVRPQAAVRSASPQSVRIAQKPVRPVTAVRARMKSGDRSALPGPMVAVHIPAPELKPRKPAVKEAYLPETGEAVVSPATFLPKRTPPVPITVRRVPQSAVMTGASVKIANRWSPRITVRTHEVTPSSPDVKISVPDVAPEKPARPDEATVAAAPTPAAPAPAVQIASARTSPTRIFLTGLRSHEGATLNTLGHIPSAFSKAVNRSLSQVGEMDPSSAPTATISMVRSGY